MTLTRIQPPGLLEAAGLTQVIVASGSRLVFVAGQGPLAADGSLLADGLVDQTRLSCEKLRVCLEAASATFADLVRMTIYVVGYEPAALEEIYAGAAAAALGEALPAPTSTLVGVEALFVPGQRIEIDAIAVLA